MGTGLATNPVLLELIFVKDGQRVEMTFHFEVGTSIPDVASMTTACQQALTSAATMLMPLMNQDTDLVGASMRTYTLSPNLSVQVPAILPTAGGVTSVALPNNVSFAVKRESGVMGRGNRGRVYWPSVSASQVTENTMLYVEGIAIASALQTFSDTMVTAGSWVSEIVYQASTNSETGVFTYAIADYTLDSQRRRLPGRGR